MHEHIIPQGAENNSADWVHGSEKMHLYHINGTYCPIRVSKKESDFIQKQSAENRRMGLQTLLPVPDGPRDVEVNFLLSKILKINEACVDVLYPPNGEDVDGV